MPSGDFTQKYEHAQRSLLSGDAFADLGFAVDRPVGAAIDRLSEACNAKLRSDNYTRGGSSITWKYDRLGTIEEYAAPYVGVKATDVVHEVELSLSCATYTRSREHVQVAKQSVVSPLQGIEAQLSFCEIASTVRCTTLLARADIVFKISVEGPVKEEMESLLAVASERAARSLVLAG